MRVLKPLTLSGLTLRVTTYVSVTTDPPGATPQEVVLTNVQPGQSFTLLPAYSMVMTINADGSVKVTVAPNIPHIGEMYVQIEALEDRPILAATFIAGNPGQVQSSARGSPGAGGDYAGVRADYTLFGSSTPPVAFCDATLYWLLSPPPVLTSAPHVIQSYDHEDSAAYLDPAGSLLSFGFIDPDTGTPIVPTNFATDPASAKGAFTTDASSFFFPDPGVGVYIFPRRGFLGDDTIDVSFARFDGYPDYFGPYPVAFRVSANRTAFWTRLKNAETALASIEKPPSLQTFAAIEAQTDRAYSRVCPPPPPITPPTPPVSGNQGTTCNLSPVYGPCAPGAGPAEGGATGQCVIDYKIICTGPGLGGSFTGAPPSPPPAPPLPPSEPPTPVSGTPSPPPPPPPPPGAPLPAQFTDAGRVDYITPSRRRHDDAANFVGFSSTPVRATQNVLSNPDEFEYQTSVRRFTCLFNKASRTFLSFSFQQPAPFSPLRFFRTVNNGTSNQPDFGPGVRFLLDIYQVPDGFSYGEWPPGQAPTNMFAAGHDYVSHTANRLWQRSADAPVCSFDTDQGYGGGVQPLPLNNNQPINAAFVMFLTAYGFSSAYNCSFKLASDA